jgi:cytochrome c biogenesis protein CcmG/thiol:disulfide interchange protein DsbE
VNWDKEADAKRFVEQYRLPFPVGRDADGRIGSLYGMEATPTSVFIAKDGKLVERHEGGLEEADFEHRIEKLLAG